MELSQSELEEILLMRYTTTKFKFLQATEAYFTKHAHRMYVILLQNMLYMTIEQMFEQYLKKLSTVLLSVVHSIIANDISINFSN